MSAEDFREWAESFVEVPDTWSFTKGHAHLLVGDANIPLTLSTAQLASLSDNEQFPRHRELRLVPHCGIILPTFAEFLVALPEIGGWPAASPLRFKVGDCLVRVGKISPALALLLEPVYRSKDHWQFEFAESYVTIQLSGTTTPQIHAQQALFYLNADYLRPFSASAHIWHLVDPNDDDAYPPEPKASSLERRRIRRRRAMTPVEPLALFNDAAERWGEARFIGFYRVLEYFFARGVIAEFGRRRRDPGVSDTQLLAEARSDRELSQLKALLKAVLTQADARSLLAFATRQGLATASSLDELACALYAYRNSVVHAKEAEVLRIAVPDPFTPKDSMRAWDRLVEKVAMHAIRRLTTQAEV